MSRTTWPTLIITVLVAASTGFAGSVLAFGASSQPMPSRPYQAIPPVDEAFRKSPPTTTGAASFSFDDTFQLHSRPGASKTIYLDFDGHDGLLGYDFDGDFAVFSESERIQIQRAWQRAAEDFSPFDVNVTTEDPGLDPLRNTGGSDDAWGVRVVIHPGAGTSGGWAYVGSFNWDVDQPVYVDTNGVGTGAKNIAEVISHEVGHSLGLGHDGQGESAYYGGHGDGSTGWAPIMGVGYYQPVTQWSRGEYSDATNSQDDLSIITTGNGFGYRPDDYGDLRNYSEANHLGGIVIHHEGIVERSSDVDAFRFFKAGDGDAHFTIQPAEFGPNLDIEATLFDGFGSVVAVSNPTDRLDAEFNLTLPAGEYFLQVDGVGIGTPDTGYSDYGSLGQYEIKGFVFSNLAGDINFDGVVDNGDIDTFVAGWRTTDHATAEQQVQHGDLNLDGTTDLRDWQIFREAFIASGNAALLVPEPPASVLLVVLGYVAAGLRRSPSHRRCQPQFRSF